MRARQLVGMSSVERKRSARNAAKARWAKVKGKTYVGKTGFTQERIKSHPAAYTPQP